jgi:hypothetical protein
MNGFTVMVLSIIYFIEPRCSGGFCNTFTTCCFVGCWHLIFREDGFIRTLGNTCATVYASVRVNVIPRPLRFWFTWYDALHRADINTTGVAQAKAGNYVGHLTNLQGYILGKLG